MYEYQPSGFDSGITKVKVALAFPVDIVSVSPLTYPLPGLFKIKPVITPAPTMLVIATVKPDPEPPVVATLDCKLYASPPAVKFIEVTDIPSE